MFLGPKRTPRSFPPQGTRVLNRKTYNALTNELMEDLNVNHEVPMEVLIRPLPYSVSHIKTVFEYGGMPTYTGTTMRK